MRLPPISALEAFEATIRHGSFTKAAEELHITSSAISQRISTLELDLGFPLFYRNGPKLRLSEQGEACRPVLLRALAQYKESVLSLDALTHDRILTVRVSPSFAEKWLNPRLADFENRYPDTDLRIWCPPGAVRIADQPGIATISYEIDPSIGIPLESEAEAIMSESVFPVCSPHYLEQVMAAQPEASLAHMRLLHDENMKPMRAFPNWQRWCEAFDIEGVDTSTGPRFSLSSLALNAAVDGRGVALGRSVLVERDLALGRLCRPFGQVFPLSFDYILSFPKQLAERRDFGVFHGWLKEQARSAQGAPAAG